MRLHTKRCDECCRLVCNSCITVMNRVAMCSDCLTRLSRIYADQATEYLHNTCPLCLARDQVFVSSVRFYKPPMVQLVGHCDAKVIYEGPVLHSEVVQCRACGNLINDHNMRLKAQAVRAERAGRYEDAAKLYEELNFLSIARSLRERDRSSVLRHVQVDINRLLEQVRQGELVIPYKCPSCGAGIKITKETSTEGLAHCPYCGESLAIADVKDFLSSLL